MTLKRGPSPSRSLHRCFSISPSRSALSLIPPSCLNVCQGATDCVFGICISMQCEGDDDDWIEIFSCSAFLEGCSNGLLCTMQSCGCPLLALASLLSSRPVLS